MSLKNNILNAIKNEFEDGLIPPAVTNKVTELCDLTNALRSTGTSDYRYFAARATLCDGDEKSDVEYYAHFKKEVAVPTKEILYKLLAFNTTFAPEVDEIVDGQWWLTCDKLLDNLELVELSADEYLSKNEIYRNNTAIHLDRLVAH